MARRKSLTEIFIYLVALYLSILFLEQKLFGNNVTHRHNYHHNHHQSREMQKQESSLSQLPSQFQTSKSLTLLMTEVLQLNKKRNNQLRHVEQQQQQQGKEGNDHSLPTDNFTTITINTKEDLKYYDNLCQKFNMKLPPSITRFNEEAITLKKRRIFAGGLIADDSWHVIGIQALETFDIFHSVVFVESNRTQNHTPRKWRFFSSAEQSNNNDNTEDFTLLTQRGIYGPNTQVHVEPFIYEQKKEPPMFREHLMRQKVLETWKKLGMTREDIGLMLDVDEIPSREFLKAAQICLPADEKLIQDNKFAVDWRTDDKQTCYSPLMRLSLTMFEGSPKCIHKEEGNEVGPRFQNKIFKRFISTSMIIGACIEGIGNSTRHIQIPRINKDIYGNYQGGRIKGYGEKRNYSKLIPEQKSSSDKTNNEKEKEFYYPLYNSADFRQMFKVLTQPLWRFGASHGYHLHNFFDSADQIRFKYAHFGHVHDTAFSVPLGGLNADMSLFVKCAHNISDAGNRKTRINQTDLVSIVGGQKHMIEDHLEPIVFHTLKGYVDARHEEMVALVEKDEEIYGRADKFDGNHLYKDYMLTHPGKIYNTELKEEEKTE